MNRQQRIAAQVAGGLLLLALLFPPFREEWRTGTRSGLSGPPRWGFISSSFDGGDWGISWTHLTLELAIIAVIAGLVFVSVRDKE
jgi:hypothetical protein